MHRRCDESRWVRLALVEGDDQRFGSKGGIFGGMPYCSSNGWFWQAVMSVKRAIVSMIDFCFMSSCKIMIY